MSSVKFGPGQDISHYEPNPADSSITQPKKNTSVHLPAEMWQEVGPKLTTESLISLHRTNKHIHAALISQVINKQIENVDDLASFKGALARIKKFPPFESSKFFSALASRIVSIEDSSEAHEATSLFNREADLLAANMRENHITPHADFHPMAETMKEVESAYEHFARDPLNPLIHKMIEGPIGNAVRNGASVMEILEENNIKNAELQDRLEFESANYLVAEKVHAMEISWSDAVVQYGYRDTGGAAQHLESVGFFRIWDE